MSRYYTHGAGRAASPDELDMADRIGQGSSRMSATPAGAWNPPRNGAYEMPSEQRAPSFDVRADFDGAGPRWSQMHGVGKHETYRPVYDHHDSGSVGALMPKQEENDPEMVTVPVLGPEWTKKELHGQSRRGQAEERGDKRKTAFKAWNRDQRGCCGISWLTRKWCVFFSFIFVVGLVVTLYFVIPRAVTFELYADDPFQNTTAPYVTRQPANFTFEAQLHLLADSGDNWIPVHFKNVEAKVLDATTENIIAHGNLGDYKMAKGRDIPIRLPVQFSYAAINGTDPTWSNFYNACQHKWNGVERDSMKWRVELKQSIIGLTTKPISVTSLMSITCPFELGEEV